MSLWFDMLVVLGAYVTVGRHASGARGRMSLWSDMLVVLGAYVTVVRHASGARGVCHCGPTC